MVLNIEIIGEISPIISFFSPTDIFFTIKMVFVKISRYFQKNRNISKKLNQRRRPELVQLRPTIVFLMTHLFCLMKPKKYLKINLISCTPLVHILDIKLIKTYTSPYLRQKSKTGSQPKGQEWPRKARLS